MGSEMCIRDSSGSAALRHMRRPCVHPGHACLLSACEAYEARGFSAAPENHHRFRRVVVPHSRPDDIVGLTSVWPGHKIAPAVFPLPGQLSFQSQFSYLQGAHPAALNGRSSLLPASLEPGCRRCFLIGFRLLFGRSLFLSRGLISRNFCFLLFGLGPSSRILGGSGRGRFLLQDT